MSLTAEQQEAVTAPGSAAVIASAGTGKTTVLTDRFSHCLKTGVPAFRILAFTFTEKATREMRERILKKSSIGMENVPLLNISTIHSFLSQLLRKYGGAAGLGGDFEILEDHAYRIWLKGKVRKAVERRLSEHDDVFLHFYRTFGLANLVHTVESLSDVNLNLEPEAALKALNDMGEGERRIYDAFLAQNRDFQKELLAERVRNRTLCYDDLESLSLEILEKRPDTRARLQNLYQHILVDEFQDVSPRQFALIRRLFNPEKNALFIVGDPKQSIYGFRQADTRLFFKMEEVIRATGGKTIYLSETFRTPRRIQSYFNAVFPTVLNGFGDELFKPATAHRDDPQACVYAADLPVDDVPNDELVADYAVRIATLAGQLLAQGDDSRDIAVIAKSRKHFAVLKAAFTHAGIPCVSETKAAQFEEELILLFYHVLLYLGGNREKIVQAGILRSPYCGFSESFIARLITSDRRTLFARQTPVEGSAEDLEKWDKLLALLEKWRDESDVLFVRELVYSIFDAVIAEPTAHDLKLLDGFVRILASWQKQGFSSLKDVIELLLVLEESDMEISPPDATEEGVRLLTVHGSKGLEFKHVFLIPGSENKSERRTFLYNKGEGFFFKNPDPGRDRGLKHELAEPPEYLGYKESLSAAEREETSRLVYVALTRTMRNLFLFPPAPRSKATLERLLREPKDATDIKDYNTWLCWLARQDGVKPLAEFRPRITAVCSAGTNEQRPAVGAGSARPRPENSAPTHSSAIPLLSVTELEIFDMCEKRFELAYLKSLQALSRPAALATRVPLAKAVKRPKSDLTSVERGNLLHEILQFYDPARDNLRNVIDQALFNQHLPDPNGAIRAECEEFVAALKRNAVLSRVLFSGATAHNELEFSLDLGDFVVNGQIDKLVLLETSRGPRWTVVDYKTHRTNFEFEEEQLAERFKFQMLCYALAVKKWFGQDEVETIIIFTSSGESRAHKYARKMLENFELELKELYGRMLSAIARRDFRLTTHKRICETCSYYKDNYCGVKSREK